MTIARKAFAATLLSAPLALLAATDTGAPSYTGAKAQASLDQFCSTESMKTRIGQAKCLQETAGQTMTFATAFHESLFKKVKVPPTAYRTQEMLDAINRIVTDQKDQAAIKNYGSTCSKIPDAIMQPDMLLDFGYTTAYNLSKYCAVTAERIARTYKLDIDGKEGKRIVTQLDRMYAYYAANPVIPPRDAFEPKQLSLHGCTRDSRAINMTVSITAKGTPDRLRKFNIDLYEETLNTAFQSATRQSTADELRAGGKASFKVHQALQALNERVSKNLGLDVQYKGLQQGSLVTEEAQESCPKLGI